ncbi:redoxin domain-containing protein [Buchnera aphidicola (Taiwanaphis decaspermi)]|uniref:peroxiredoxin n=1 Tax=Buchnera aphidicola TaxID=9 RepID=UPI0031B804A9
MSLVTSYAPDFTSSAVLKDNKIINNFNFRKFSKKKMVVIFFWPMDFTFVCPTELVMLDKLYNEFELRKVKIIGISIDSPFVHIAWRNTSIYKGGIGNVKYIMVSDIKRKIQKMYNIEHPKLGVALRATFIIDKENIIRHQLVNDLPIGRNIKETLRTIDAINFHDNNGEVCPSEWKKGDKGIIPSTQGIIKYFKKK